ncbi:hypothetical protein HOC80_01830 [archaeon]|jgi:hypothetical protein|nr:hypothetical protein [archaeon]MBT4416821.1 hypothetical protein [archaeon]
MVKKVHKQIRFERDGLWHILNSGVVDTEVGNPKYTKSGETLRPDQVRLNQSLHLGQRTFDRESVLSDIYKLVDVLMDQIQYPFFALEVTEDVTHSDFRGMGECNPRNVLLNLYLEG